MTEIETDQVLSAIRRGEDSLPKLRAATGLEYAQLHKILYDLQFDAEIQQVETGLGFARFVIKSQNGNGNKPSAPADTPISAPMAYARTKASLRAEEITIIQRDAPYCVTCRGLCFYSGLSDEGRVQWTCRACVEVFGGTMQEMAIILPEKSEELTRRPEAEAKADPEVERALARMRDETDETCVDCGKPCSPTSGQRCRACYLARAEAKRETPATPEPKRNFEVFDRQTMKSASKCGCGRPSNHGGRCAYRRKTSPSLADDLAAQRKGGRPRVEVDLQKFEDLLANPRLTINEVCEGAGIKRNLIYDRKDIDPEFGAAYQRGMERREAAIAGGALRMPEGFSESMKRFGPFCETNCDPPTVGHHEKCAYWKEHEAAKARAARNDDSTETEETATTSPLSDDVGIPDTAKHVTESDLPPKVSKSTQIMQKIMPQTAQVQVMGGLRLHEDIQVRVSEMAHWPADRIEEFFDALAKVIEIPHRPLPTKMRPAWSTDFESDHPEDTRGLTMCYLIGMLHHNMEPQEKEAVWTLVQYLKKIEAYVEQEKEAKTA